MKDPFNFITKGNKKISGSVYQAISNPIANKDFSVGPRESSIIGNACTT